MKHLPVFLLIGVLTWATPQAATADTILLVDFSSTSTFSVGGGAAGYWGLADLGGTASIPSQFEQGGSQSGSIFYGSYGRGDGPALLTVMLPDLTRYTDLQLTVSLAAPDGTKSPTTLWEITHRDSLVISGWTGSAEHVIDTFRPTSGSSPLQSAMFGTDLHYVFQDFTYDVLPDLHGMQALTFAFASSAGDEVLGIDSLRITGTPVPEPTSLLLLASGLTALVTIRRQQVAR